MKINRLKFNLFLIKNLFLLYPPLLEVSFKKKYLKTAGCCAFYDEKQAKFVKIMMRIYMY